MFKLFSEPQELCAGQVSIYFWWIDSLSEAERQQTKWERERKKEEDRKERKEKLKHNQMIRRGDKVQWNVSQEEEKVKEEKE